MPPNYLREASELAAKRFAEPMRGMMDPKQLEELFAIGHFAIEPTPETFQERENCKSRLTNLTPETITLRQALHAMPHLCLNDAFVLEQSRKEAIDLNPAAYRELLKECDDGYSDIIEGNTGIKLVKPVSKYLAMVNALCALADPPGEAVKPAVLREGVEVLDAVIASSKKIAEQDLQASHSPEILENDAYRSKADSMLNHVMRTDAMHSKKPEAMPENIYRELLELKAKRLPEEERLAAETQIRKKLVDHLRTTMTLQGTDYRRSHEKYQGTAHLVSADCQFLAALRDQVQQIAQALDIRIGKRELG